MQFEIVEGSRVMKKKVLIISAASLTAIVILILVLSGILSHPRKVEQYFETKELIAEDGTSNFIKAVTLKLICDKEIKSTGIISKAYGFDKLPENTSKYIGEPLYINSTAKYEWASVKIEYNPGQIEGFNIKKLIALRYDEEMKKFQVLKTTLDKDGNTISFKTYRLGEFILIENNGIIKADGSIGVAEVQSNLSGNTAKAYNGFYDTVIYGGTSAGVIAACKAARLGLSVVLISKDTHLGGMSASGLSLTDAEDWNAVGGMAREFYTRGMIHYFKESESSNGFDVTEKEEIAGIKKHRTFEPHVAENIFNELIKEENITVLNGRRLRLHNGVELYNKSIRSIKTESGDVIRGKIFVDASYEGDLMAKAGVSYTVGREDNRVYGERYNGIRYQNSLSSQQLPAGIDPYIDSANPSLGYIKGIKELNTGEGAGDKGIQAYCFRMCLTDNVSNMADYKDENNDGIRDYVKPPEYYHKDSYELLFRYIEAEKNGRLSEKNFNKGLNTFFCLDRLPNGKIDANNCGPVSTDYIGANYSYPEAGYELREVIIKKHEDYQRGFLWTLQFSDDPRIPKYIRDFYRKYGLAKDEFADNNNWPYQLYIREARRMVSDYVMTDHNSLGTRVAKDSIGLASYPIDSHNTQRYVHTQNYVKYIQNEGCLFMDDAYKPSWPISFKSIVPKKEECTNLIVPVAISASHAAYGAIRMEPTFMIMAESAASAAKIAIQENSCIVQDVEYSKLKKALKACGQILE